jgi:hypothetical protein
LKRLISRFKRLFCGITGKCLGDTATSLNYTGISGGWQASALRKPVLAGNFQKIPCSCVGDRFRWTASATIQSYQTADFQAESKQAVSVGIFAGTVLFSRSPVTLAVSQAEFSLPSLHPKIPFPAAGFPTANNVRRPGILGSWEAKNAISSRDTIIAGSIRAPRTACSIRLAHRATVRLRCLAAAGLRLLL